MFASEDVEIYMDRFLSKLSASLFVAHQEQSELGLVVKPSNQMKKK